MKAYHVMTPDVITVQADTTVAEIAYLLTTHRIGGVPVVDNERRVIGIVSEDDLFLKEKGVPFSGFKIPTLFKHWVGPNRLVRIYKSAREYTAADVMTHKVIYVDVEEEIERIAWLMVQHNIKRVPVLQDGKLVGIITRADLIRLLVQKE